MIIPTGLRKLWDGNAPTTTRRGGLVRGILFLLAAFVCFNYSYSIIRWPMPARLAGWGLLCLAVVAFVVSVRDIAIGVWRLGLKQLFVRLLISCLVIVLVVGLLVPTEKQGLNHWLATATNVTRWMISGVYEIGRKIVEAPSTIGFALTGQRKLIRVPGIVWKGDVPPTPIIVKGNTDSYREPVPQPNDHGFQIGDEVWIIGTGDSSLRSRSSPSISAEVVALYRPGEILQIVGGPQIADGHTWWKVHASDGREGWCAAEYLGVANPQK